MLQIWFLILFVGVFGNKTCKDGEWFDAVKGKCQFCQMCPGKFWEKAPCSEFSDTMCVNLFEFARRVELNREVSGFRPLSVYKWQEILQENEIILTEKKMISRLNWDDFNFSSSTILIAVILTLTIVVVLVNTMGSLRKTNRKSGPILTMSTSAPTIATTQAHENKITNIDIIIRNDSPITFYVGYNNYRSMWANWSTLEEYKDDSSHYAVLDYTNYEDTFDKFKERYPFVTIETDGKAISQSTFGDKGKGKFGTLYVDTRKFNDSKGKYIELIVSASDYKFAAYSIYVQIGIIFQTTGTKLYLTPSILAGISSEGALKRYFDFGLTVNNIIFHPKIDI